MSSTKVNYPILSLLGGGVRCLRAARQGKIEVIKSGIAQI